jgi:hypothetical protein
MLQTTVSVPSCLGYAKVGSPLTARTSTLSASRTHTIVLVHPLNESDYSAIYKRKFKQFHQYQQQRIIIFHLK